MAHIIFSGDSDALRQVSGEPGKEGPSRDRGAARTISQRKKTQATAKLQIYWSGNKYKYLIKKLLWKDLYTTVSCLESATPALTPNLSAQVQGSLRVAGAGNWVPAPPAT